MCPPFHPPTAVSPPVWGASKCFNGHDAIGSFQHVETQAGRSAARRMLCGDTSFPCTLSASASSTSLLTRCHGCAMVASDKGAVMCPSLWPSRTCDGTVSTEASLRTAAFLTDVMALPLANDRIQLEPEPRQPVFCGADLFWLPSGLLPGRASRNESPSLTLGLPDSTDVSNQNIHVH